jgi:tetratricopeptide (TPR) repeat protein
MGDRRKHLEFLRQTAREAVWSGDFERALELYEEGLALARQWNDPNIGDLFLCNRAAILIELGRSDFDLAQVRSIIIRDPNGFNGALAAYSVARAHELRREFAKAAFYAQTALTRARDMNHAQLAGSSLNLLGNLRIYESDFAAAMPLYSNALDVFERVGDPMSREAAQTEDNIGYCHLAQDRVREGLTLVDHALGRLEQLGARQATVYPCLDLCFGHLKLESFDEAEHWGIRALALGSEFRRTDAVKNSHYLLGEIYAELGRDDDAESHYDALATFYPEFPSLKNFLHQINLVEMINLRM